MSIATLNKKRADSPRVSEMVMQADGPLPVWVRGPSIGVEHFSGFTRPFLYQLAKDGKIRSVSIREDGAVKGTRLFHLKSILEFIERCEQVMNKVEEAEA